MYYSMSGCLDVHESWSKTSSWDTTCGSVGLLVSLVTVSIISCYNTSRTAAGVTGWCSRRVHPCEAGVPAYGQHQPWCGKVGGCSDLTWRAVEAVFDVGSTWVFTHREENWQAGRRVGGNGGVEQGELSLDMCVDVTAGYKKASDTQSGAVSRLADCMIRAGWVHKMESQRMFAWLFVWQSEKERGTMYSVRFAVHNKVCYVRKAATNIFSSSI